jgi:hypothetical protein
MGAKSTDPSITRKATLEYSLAATCALSSPPKPQSQNCRFAFTSWILTIKEWQKIVVPYGRESKTVAVCPLPRLFFFFFFVIHADGKLIQGKRETELIESEKRL